MEIQVLVVETRFCSRMEKKHSHKPSPQQIGKKTFGGGGGGGGGGIVPDAKR